jgi:hypothetical protein
METETTTQLQSLLARSTEYDEHKADYVNPATSHFVTPDARLTVATGFFGAPTVQITPLELTEQGLRQLCSKLGPAVFGKGCARSLPYEYINAIKPELRATVLNEHITRAEGDWMVRAYDDKCRAVLSSGYTAIGNTELIDLLEQINSASKTPGHLTTRSSVTPDSLNVQLIYKDVDTPRGRFGYGVNVSNGETGNRRLRVTPVVKVHSCDNSIIADSGKGALEFIHRGSSVTKRVLIRSAMAEVFPWAAKLLERMIEAYDEQLVDFNEIVNGLAKQHGWSEDLKMKVCVGTEGQETRAGMVNGITYAAHSIKDPDEMNDMEVLGGAILMAPGSVFHKAVRIARLAAEQEED